MNAKTVVASALPITLAFAVFAHGVDDVRLVSKGTQPCIDYNLTGEMVAPERAVAPFTMAVLGLASYAGVAPEYARAYDARMQRHKVSYEACEASVVLAESSLTQDRS